MAAATSELKQLIAELSDEQARQVADFAKFLRWNDERREWREFGQQQFANAYGDGEPEYTLADRREEPKS
jgi:hypothetical protein